MPVTWKTTDSFERLLAAWWASSETHKPNYRLIAKYYGKGTTYDSIEGRFRHIKRQAEALKAESSTSTSTSTSASTLDNDGLDSPAQSFASTSASFNNGSSQNGTPKKARAPRTPKKDATNGGRVSKNSTPTKTPRGRRVGVNGGGAMAGRNGYGHAEEQQGVKLEMVSTGESSQSGSGCGSMLDELNEVVDGEVDWMGAAGDGPSGFGVKGRNGVGNGIGGGLGAQVGEGYENEGYWDVGDVDGDEELGEMV